MILLSVGDRMQIDLRHGQIRFTRGGREIRFHDDRENDLPFEFSSLPNTVMAAQIAKLLAAVHGLHLTRLSSTEAEIVFEFG